MGGPVIMTPNLFISTSKQIHDYLLCNECEQLLHKNCHRAAYSTFARYKCYVLYFPVPIAGFSLCHCWDVSPIALTIGLPPSRVPRRPVTFPVFKIIFSSFLPRMRS
jgi:hypothetical protein